MFNVFLILVINPWFPFLIVSFDKLFMKDYRKRTYNDFPFYFPILVVLSVCPSPVPIDELSLPQKLLEILVKILFRFFMLQLIESDSVC